MRFLRKNNIFIMISVCLILVVSINLTYSKFTYSKEVNGSLVTVQQILTFYQTLASKSSTLDTSVNFKNAASSSNGQGLMMRNGTQSSTYPILYYRGNVTDNNVIYGGFCWLIVRTTETGGVKLLYNGLVNSDGSCNNYSGVGGVTANSNHSGACIKTSVFNTNYNSPVYVGYMRNSVIYDLNTSTGKTNYKSHLADNSIDTSTGRHTQNKTNSTIKGVIDAWYKTNIEGKTFESLLEDTVWCNDRSVTSTTYTIDNYSSNNYFNFSAYTRIEETSISTPILTCSREMDSFTVEKTNGNGDFTYPVGMLTADEIVMAGKNGTTFLTIPDYYYWTMSPRAFDLGFATVFCMDNFNPVVDNSDNGVRPSISLGNWATVSGGDGSFSQPYIIN